MTVLVFIVATTFIWGCQVRSGYCKGVGSLPQKDSILFTVNFAGEDKSKKIGEEQVDSMFAIFKGNQERIIGRQDKLKKIGEEQVDSMFAIFKGNQEWIIKRQETLINDLRQETNNNIDKLSVWTGVMLGLVALFGALVPMWQSNINRNELERDINKELKNVKKKFKEYEKETKGNIIAQNKEVKELISRMNRQLILSELQTTVECLALGLDSKQIDNSDELRSFKADLWSKIGNNFVKLVVLINEDFERNNMGELSIRDVKIVLVSALELIDEIMRRVAVRTGDISTREEISLTLDNLRFVLNRVCSSTFKLSKAFLQELEEFAKEVNMVQLRW